MDVGHPQTVHRGPIIIQDSTRISAVGIQAPVGPAHSLLVSCKVLDAIEVQISIHVVGQLIHPLLITRRQQLASKLTQEKRSCLILEDVTPVCIPHII